MNLIDPHLWQINAIQTILQVIGQQLNFIFLFRDINNLL